MFSPRTVGILAQLALKAVVRVFVRANLCLLTFSGLSPCRVQKGRDGKFSCRRLYGLVGKVHLGPGPLIKIQVISLPFQPSPTQCLG